MSITVEGVVSAVGLALLHFLWQGAVLGAVLAVALAMMSRRPHLRVLRPFPRLRPMHQLCRCLSRERPWLNPIPFDGATHWGASAWHLTSR